MNIVEIPLTRGYISLVDAEHAHLVQKYSWYENSGYAFCTSYVTGSRKTFLMHRFLWELFHGTIPIGGRIEHINGNNLDNRLDNLRTEVAKHQGERFKVCFTCKETKLI